MEGNLIRMNIWLLSRIEVKHHNAGGFRIIDLAGSVNVITALEEASTTIFPQKGVGNSHVPQLCVTRDVLRTQLNCNPTWNVQGTTGGAGNWQRHLCLDGG